MLVALHGFWLIRAPGSLVGVDIAPCHGTPDQCLLYDEADRGDDQGHSKSDSTGQKHKADSYNGHAFIMMSGRIKQHR